MVSYNVSLRGAIQTHCATVNVDSTFEIWTPTPPPPPSVNVHPWHKFFLKKIHESNMKKDKRQPCKNQNRCPKTSVYRL